MKLILKDGTEVEASNSSVATDITAVVSTWAEIDTMNISKENVEGGKLEDAELSNLVYTGEHASRKGDNIELHITLRAKTEIELLKEEQEAFKRAQEEAQQKLKEEQDLFKEQQEQAQREIKEEQEKLHAAQVAFAADQERQNAAINMLVESEADSEEEKDVADDAPAETPASEAEPAEDAAEDSKDTEPENVEPTEEGEE